MAEVDVSHLFQSLLKDLDGENLTRDRMLSAVKSCLDEIRYDPDLATLIEDIQNDRPLAMLRHDLGSRKRAIKLAALGGWTVELATPYLDSATAIAQARDISHGSTVATKFAVASVGKDVSCKIQIWTSNVAENADPVAAQGTVLTQSTTVELNQWDCWMAPSSNLVVRMPPDAHRPVWLLFIGPQLADYIHGYDTVSGEYTHSSFASLQLTSHDLLTVLMHEYSGFLLDRDEMSETDRSVMSSLANEMLVGPSLALNSRWRLCQILAQIEPDTAVAELRSLAGSNSSLALKARNALHGLGVSQ